MNRVIARLIVTLISFASIISEPVFSQVNTDSGKKLSYDRYIEIIKEQLPELKKNRVQVEKAKNTLYGSGSEGDINVTGETGYGKYETLSKGTVSKTRNVTSKLGLSKKILQTGTELGTGVEYERTEYESYGSTVYHSPSVYITFSQSLLKNAFGTIDKYAENNARMQLDIEKLREQEYNKSDINYYKKLYFTWIEYREELKMINTSIDSAVKLEDTVKNKYKSGMANNADLYSTAAAVLNYRIAYEELQSDISIIESELKIFLNGYGPENDEFYKYYDLSFKSDYKPEAFEKTANAEIYRITKDNLRYTADVSENRLLPQLDLVGEYTRKSEDESFTKSASGMNSTDYYVGLSFTYPLQNTENRSKLNEIKLSIREINSEYLITENSYKKSLGTILNNYRDYVKIISLREKRLEALEKKYYFQLRKYQQSQLDLETLLNTSIDITNERISFIQLKKKLIENWIDYKDLTR